MALLIALAATPSYSEESSGFDLMERGAELFFDGLLQEFEPALRDLQNLGETVGPKFKDFFVQMGPALTDLMEQVEDWSRYHPPEVLDNGDIIIRRKADVAPNEEIEL